MKTQVSYISAHTELIADVAMNHHSCVSCSRDKTIRLWQRETSVKCISILWENTFVRGVDQTENQRVFSCGDDGLIKIWDFNTDLSTESVAPIQCMIGHDDAVSCVRLHSNNNFLFSTGFDNKVALWDIEKAILLQAYPTESRAHAVRLSQESVFLSVEQNGRVSFGDHRQPRFIHHFNHEDGYNAFSVCIAADGLFGASGGEDFAINLYDLRDLRHNRSIKNIGGGITGLALSQDSRLLVSGDDSNQLCWWDFGGATLVKRYQGDSANNWIASLAMNNKGDKLLLGSGNGKLRYIQEPLPVTKVTKQVIHRTGIKYLAHARLLVPGVLFKHKQEIALPLEIWEQIFQSLYTSTRLTQKEVSGILAYAAHPPKPASRSQFAKWVYHCTLKKEDPMKNIVDPKKITDTKWYTDKEMNQLLSFYLCKNGEVEFIKATLGTNWQEADINLLKDDLIKFNNARFGAIQREEIVKDKVVVPVNLNNHHWVLLYFIYQRDGATLPTVYYFDPLGDDIQEDIRAAVKADRLFPGVEIIHVSARVQSDGYNCGPWVIEATRGIALKGALPGEDFNIQQARREHSEALGRLGNLLSSSQGQRDDSLFEKHKRHQTRYDT